MLPKVSSYGKYDSDNYGVHTLRVSFAGIDFYYSYDTIVAYRDFTDGLVCSKNYWGVTTGKHLNWIQPDKSMRVDDDTFKTQLDAAILRHIA